MSDMKRSVAAWLGLAVALTTAGGTAQDGKPPWVEDRAAWRQKTMTERHAIRRELEQSAFERVERAAEKPWSTKRAKHFLALSNADRKFTARAIKAADEFFEWCHEQFDAASDEYVRRRVLRIVATEGEDGNRSPLVTSRRGLVLDTERELSTRRDEDHGNSGLQFADLFRDVLDVYWMDKDPLLYRYAPPWFALGFGDVAGTIYLKSGRIQFRPSDDERDDLRMLVRNGRAATMRELLRASGDHLLAIESGADGERHQFTKLARFLLFGPGRKHALTRDFLARYARAVVLAAEARQADWDPKALDEVEGIEDAEAATAARKARDEEFRSRQAAVAEAAFEMVCGEWTDAQWEQIERVFLEFEVR